jgi:hypothetical protein
MSTEAASNAALELKTKHQVSHREAAAGGLFTKDEALLLEVVKP